MILNCDIGERGENHPVDVALMSEIGLANLACGGHAGDAGSVRAFRERAQDLGVVVSAHLSYPDRKHFGRISMNLSGRDLERALERQWELLPDVSVVKLHGALYNDASTQPERANEIAAWLVAHHVEQVLCPPGSEMERAVTREGMKVCTEAFVERRYARDAEGRVVLLARSDPRASIQILDEAVDQARSLIKKGGVVDMEGNVIPLEAETLCIHSDSPLALPLARKVKTLLKKNG